MKTHKRLILEELGFKMNEQREIVKGEIYWSNQPFCKGHIQKGSRPYLVVSARNNKGYITIMPVTSKIKEISNRHNIVVKDKQNQVLCDQPQTVPISTLGRYLDRVTSDDVDECLSVMLDCFDYVSADLEYFSDEEEFWEKLYFDSLDEND